LFSKIIGLLCINGMLEEASQDFSLFFVPAFGVLPDTVGKPKRKGKI